MDRLKIILLGIVAMVGVLGILPAAAQDAPPADVEVSDALVEQVEGIEAFVNDVRGLETLDPVNRVFPSRADVAAFLQESIDEQLTPELVEQSVAFYYAFDFIDDPELDIVGIYLDLIEDQIGGYYDPEDKSMNTILISGDGVLGDELPLLEQIIYAHEFVHALQDQHYDLAALGFSAETDPDEIAIDSFLARQALVEGDATFVMNAYTEVIITENPLAAMSLLGASITSSAIPEGTPDILTRELFFPYTTGLTFVTALIEQGGMSAVDDAFNDLPVSTEQILHPEKYLEGELPVTVTLSPTDAALGAGWDVLDEDTLGEFYLRAFLDENIVDRATWRDAAAGWGGDRYRIFRGDEGAIAMVLRIAWDAPGDQGEFDDAFAMWGETHYGTAPVDGCWSDATTAFCVGTVGNESVVTRAPSLEAAQALLTSQS